MAAPRPSALVAVKADPEAAGCLYFAYGSNLLPQQMAERTGCLDAGLPCRLQDHRLVFNKRSIRMPGSVFANVVPAPGEMVWGVGYRCSDAMLALLDTHEGVSDGHYHRQAMTMLGPREEPLAAFVYLAGADYVVEERTPHPTYAQLIMDGARHHGLPSGYLRALAQWLAMNGEGSLA